MFIGWYINKTNKINKIPLNDSYRQYLNYYLGWGNYAKKVYKTDKKAIIFAKSVKTTIKYLQKTIKSCQKKFGQKKIYYLLSSLLSWRSTASILLVFFVRRTYIVGVT